MKYILLSFFSFAFFLSYGQGKNPVKKELVRVFTITMNQQISENNGSCENGLCGEWVTNNKDSAFYKHDTLRLYNSSNIMYDTNHYCNFKVLVFSTLNRVLQHSIEICHEPPMSTMEIPFGRSQLKGQKKWNKVPVAPEKYRIIEKDSAVFLILYTDYIIFHTFKVIGIGNHDSTAYGDQSFVITLVRERVR